MKKSDVRKYIRMQKQLYSDDELRQLSAPIVSRLMAHPRVKSAKTILMYYSLPDEVFTHEALDALLGQGKTVLLPAVVSDTRMELRHYEGPGSLLGGFFDIMEPVGKPFDELAAIDVAIVPGMSFDGLGHRLGRGRGYYDRFLPLIPQAYKIGICFPFQKLPGIPADALDVPMDEVL